MEKYIYYALIALTVLLSLQIWYVTNIPSAREAGYIIWQQAAAIVLFMVGLLMSSDFIESKKWSKGLYFVFGILIFNSFVTINYATVITELEILKYYSLLSLTAAILIDISLVGNVVGLEKKRQGFNISIHDKDSPITPQMIIPIWIAVFVAMGFFVTVSGSVLVSYPQFGILPGLGTPMSSSFPIGDAENIIFMFLPFAITAFLLNKFGVPHFATAAVSTMAGTISFIGYHSFVYGMNVPAMVSVGFFALICNIIYYFTKSIVIPSAIHISNNFWGALYSKTVFGLSVVEGFGGSMAFTAFSLIGIVVMLLLIIKFFGKPSKKSSGSGFRIIAIIALLAFITIPMLPSASAGLDTCSVCNETCSPCGGGCNTTDLSYMYKDVTNFDATYGNISGWNTSCITNMAHMFENSDFNQDISSWDVSNVTDMSYMFADAPFNQDISSWDVGSVTNMNGMFWHNYLFNQDISSWDVSSVTNMANMFLRDYPFNQPLNNWNVSRVTNMSFMFYYTSLNQDISSWDVSRVTDMEAMFSFTSFNQDISSWNVSSVTNMRWMFSYNTFFNQDISSWDVSSVTDMLGMFYKTDSFDQSLGNWNISSVTDMTGMFMEADAMSMKNYSLTLIGWGGLPYVQSNVRLDATDASGNGIDYYSTATPYRQNLITNYSWNIYDGNEIMTPPQIVIQSPENRTYMTNTIDLNWSVGVTPSWAAYSLNDAANITLYKYKTIEQTDENWTACYTGFDASHPCSNIYDDNLSSYATAAYGSGTETGFSYNKPDNLVNAIIEVKYGDSTVNYTLNSTCLSGGSNNSVHLKMLIDTNYVGLYNYTYLFCIDDYDTIPTGDHTILQTLGFHGSCTNCNEVYDVKIWWNTTDGFKNTTITAQEGSNNLVLYVNDSLGNMNSTTVYFTVNTINDYIEYSDIKSQYPSPTTYNSSRTLQMFNATISWNSTEQNLTSVIFNFNGTNYTVTTNRSIDANNAEFYYILNGGLGAGNYTYYWFAHGTVNSNSTSLQDYEVQKASPSPSMSLSSSAGWSITQGTTTTITGSETNSGDGGCTYSLYRDNSAIANPDTILFPAEGTYEFRYNTSGCQNYTSGYVTATLTVTSSSSGGGGGGGGEEEEVLVGGENWTYVNEEFFLVIAPYDSITKQIRILNNEFQDIEEIESYECKGVGDFDMCPYVIIDDTIRINGEESSIAPGQIGEINFTIDTTKEYITENNLPNVDSGLYTFSILLTINGVTKPMNVDVWVTPGGEVISQGLDWLTDTSVVVPGEQPTIVPNWFIAIVAIIASIIGGAYLIRWIFRPKSGFHFIPKKKRYRFEPIDYAIIAGAISMAIIAFVFLLNII